MKTQFKKIWNLSAAVSLALASGFAMAAGNDITFEGDTANNGVANYANIDAQSTTGTKTVSIYQVGDGTGADAAQKNQVGDATNKLTLTGAATNATAHIGQGAHWNGVDTWTKTAATHGNMVSGTITTGEARISQNSNGNTVAMNINGDGLVTVNQGNTTTGGGGSGFSADVTQNGGGAVTVNQGSTGGTSGSATVVHAGSHTVAITQDHATNADLGVVKTNTTDDGLLAAGSLTITHSNSGKTYVNGDVDGADNLVAANIEKTAVIVNAGTGIVHLKDATGNVSANVTGAGTLTMTQSGSGNIYVNDAGDSFNAAPVSIDGTSTLVNSGSGTVALTQADGNVYANISGGDLTVRNTGATNEVFVNAAGNSFNADPGMTGGTLTLNSDGTSNTIKVQSFAGGTMTVDQGSAMEGSLLTLTSTNVAASTAVINQTGSFQDANVHSVNGSTGTFNLEAVGITTAHTTLDLTM